MSRVNRPHATAVLAAAMLTLPLAACGSAEPVGQQAPPSTVTAAPTTPPTSTATSAPRSVGALDFTATTLDGKTFDAATLAGKPVVLWFWAPWCPTCAAEAPDVLDIHQRFAGKVTVIGVAGLDERANMQPFVDRTKTGSITHLADAEGVVWRRFDVAQQSTYVLLDKAGNVTFSGILGTYALRDKVADLIG